MYPLIALMTGILIVDALSWPRKFCWPDAAGSGAPAFVPQAPLESRRAYCASPVDADGRMLNIQRQLFLARQEKHVLHLADQGR
jgi:hypothetical protein